MLRLNGLSQIKQYDNQGRLESHTAGDYSRDYGYDANGNILDIQGSLNSLYEYDPLDRLIDNTVSELGIDMHWGYDENGNRTEAIDTNVTTTLDYQANSNRLITVGANTITVDASGRTISDQNGRYYEYNNAGRLETLRQGSATGAVIGEYHYNASQLRTRKTVAENTIVYHYDLAGNMLAESDEQGETNREYLYADGERVALLNKEREPDDVVVTPPPPSSTMPIDRETAKKILPIIILYLLDDDGEAPTPPNPEPPVTPPPAQSYQWTVHYYINDHLQTPQRLLDDKNVVSWEADYEAFGKATITTDTVEQNHRFPGQYYDEESQLHYNWNRYYDNEVGRYVTSDPIGLKAGTNTFGYVLGNPLRYSDPTGLVNAGQLAFEACFYALAAGIAYYGSKTINTIGDALCGEDGSECLISESKGRPKGFLPGDVGAREWDRRNGGGRKGRDKFHEIKQGDRGPRSGASDDTSVNPETGEVLDGNGENIGSLDE